MNSARLSPVLVCLALAPGCGSSPGQTTSASATDGSSGADTTTSAASTTSTTTDEVTTGAPDSTGAASTSTTTTTGTSTGEASTGAAATGSTDTGSTACEPSWVVPSVAAEELAKHDLQWVSCELLTCGADDLPQPGVLCDEFSLAGVPLEYLGHIHPNDSGAFTTGDVIGPTNIAWLDAPRHTYRYGDAVYVMTEQDGAADQLEVFFTVRALEILRTDHPAAYQKLVVDVAEFPAEQPLDGLTWKNRVRSVVISFDTSPLYIAAGITVLDAAPTKDKNLDQYSNVAAISIDRETIRGASDEVGSRPIYQKPGDDENFLRYMREGIAETLVHELLHRHVDRLNSVDAAMNDLYFRRGDMAACARFELEEALVAAASLLHFRKAGGIGETYLDYYDVVLDANLEVVMQCPEFAAWEAQFSAPSGVDPRYDLRLVDL
jgi:hypothetical protein